MQLRLRSVHLPLQGVVAWSLRLAGPHHASVCAQIQAHDLNPALAWVDEHRLELFEASPFSAEDFEFRLHRLQFVQLLTTKGKLCPSVDAADHLLYVGQAALSGGPLLLLLLLQIREQLWHTCARKLSASKAARPARLPGSWARSPSADGCRGHHMRICWRTASGTPWRGILLATAAACWAWYELPQWAQQAACGCSVSLE